jgi:hypothetical protein
MKEHALESTKKDLSVIEVHMIEGGFQLGSGESCKERLCSGLDLARI